MTDTDLNYLNDLTWSYRSGRILQVAVELELFTRLARQPQTVDALARACGAKPDLLERVLIACCALGFLDRQGGHFANTALAAEYLVKGQPLYQGDIIGHAATVWRFWDELPGAIRTQPVTANPAAGHRSFILGMHNITMAGRGQIFLDRIDLTGRRRLIDIGGGPGTYSILACRQYPQLRATVFDLPETIAIARETVAKAGLADRIDFREGSWETHEFGTGYDVALLSNVLHGAGSQAPMKLAKARAALLPGGRVAVQEFLLNNEKTGPLIPALFQVMVGAYSEAELLAEIGAAGFQQVQLAARHEPSGSGWFTALKPQ